MTIGIPVYLHYCGGELEDVSYVIRKVSCCGEEEDSGMDCCMDQNLVLRSTPDFTVSHQVHLDAAGHFTRLFYCHGLFYFRIIPQKIVSGFSVKFPPPKLFSEALVSVSVLRI